MKYFGPASGRKEWEEQVKPPIGEPCILCEEPIEPGDIGTINIAGQVAYHACSIRAVIGSVGHQLGKCSCFGGAEEDPPGMSRREAALAAAELFYERQGK
jgi:hypothetical protein